MSRDELVNFALEVMPKFLAQAQGVAFTADFYGAHVFKVLALPEPPDMRLLGSVFSRAKRAGLIKQLTVNSFPVCLTTSSKHKSPLWIAA